MTEALEYARTASLCMIGFGAVVLILLSTYFIIELRRNKCVLK